MIRCSILLICLTQLFPALALAQGETEAQQLHAWLYANANTNTSVSPSEIVERLSGKSVAILGATIHDQENAICHLLATRGCTLELCFLLDRMSVADRKLLIGRLNSSYDTRNWLVQHKLLIGFKSDHWIGEFQKRGLDFSLPPSSDIDVKRLQTAVQTRWYGETEAYRQHLKLISAREQSANNNKQNAE